MLLRQQPHVDEGGVSVPLETVGFATYAPFTPLLPLQGERTVTLSLDQPLGLAIGECSDNSGLEVAAIVPGGQADASGQVRGSSPMSFVYGQDGRGWVGNTEDIFL